MNYWKERLSSEGFRITRPRMIVMDILNRADVPLTPSGIYQKTLKTGNNIGMVSVYRALDIFLCCNLIRRVHLDDGCHGYVVATPGHHHTIVCRRCRATIEFSGTEDLSVLFMHVEKDTGFTIDDHLLQLFGLCKNCQGRQ